MICAKQLLVSDPGEKQYERRSDSGDFRGKYGLRNVYKLVIIKLRSKIIV